MHRLDSRLSAEPSPRNLHRTLGIKGILRSRDSRPPTKHYLHRRKTSLDFVRYPSSCAGSVLTRFPASSDHRSVVHTYCISGLSSIRGLPSPVLRLPTSTTVEMPQQCHLRLSSPAPYYQPSHRQPLARTEDLFQTRPHTRRTPQTQQASSRGHIRGEP